MIDRRQLIAQLCAALALLPVTAGSQAPHRTEIVDSLRRALHDSDSRNRSNAAFELGHLGPAASVAVTDLLRLAEGDSSSRVRWMAARALGWIGQPACGAVPGLLALAPDPDPDVRADVLTALGGIGLGCGSGRYDRAILDTLNAFLGDSASFVRGSALESLGELGSVAMPELAAALSQPDDTLASRAAVLIGQLPSTPLGVASLRAALGDSRTGVRLKVAHALAGYGASTRAALTAAAGNDSATVRDGAREALRYLDYATASPVSNRCDRLTMSPWAPRLQIGEDTIFSTPPEAVRFSTVEDEMESPDSLPRLRVEPALGMPYTVHGPGSWRPARDSVVVVWSTGYSGLGMRLHVVGDSLSGTASTFWDFPRGKQLSNVRGMAVPCG